MRRAPTRIVFIFVVLAGLVPASALGAAHYATTYGSGLDKWATAWLLTNRVDPGAKLSVVDDASQLPEEAITFAVHGGHYTRTDERAAFEVVLDQLEAVSEAGRRLGEIIHRLEVVYWKSSGSPATLSVEQAFRRLQRSADRVPPECFVRFFGAVYTALRKTPRGEPLPAEMLSSVCPSVSATRQSADKARIVETVPISRLLEARRHGKDVVFVDTREHGEYAEVHIPGAVNLQIYAVDKASTARLRQADIVVSYCVKDFRGFEMAKLLLRYGVERSVLMNPYGLKGWIASGLPVAGKQGLPGAKARKRLRRCIASGTCIEEEESQ